MPTLPGKRTPFLSISSNRPLGYLMKGYCPPYTRLCAIIHSCSFSWRVRCTCLGNGGGGLGAGGLGGGNGGGLGGGGLGGGGLGGGGLGGGNGGGLGGGNGGGLGGGGVNGGGGGVNAGRVGGRHFIVSRSCCVRSSTLVLRGSLATMGLASPHVVQYSSVADRFVVQTGHVQDSSRLACAVTVSGLCASCGNCIS